MLVGQYKPHAYLTQFNHNALSSLQMDDQEHNYVNSQHNKVQPKHSFVYIAYDFVF